MSLTNEQFSRRSFLNTLGGGIGAGSVALQSLLADNASSALAGGSHFSPSAKRVIFLFMSGGPSHQWMGIAHSPDVR